MYHMLCFFLYWIVFHWLHFIVLLTAIMNNAVMSIHVQSLVWTTFHFSIRIARPYGNSMLTFWGNTKLFSIVAALLAMPRVPISPPHPHLLSLFFIIVIILVTMKWYLTEDLIWIYLMANHVEYQFLCSLSIWRMSNHILCLFLNWVVPIFIIMLKFVYIF